MSNEVVLRLGFFVAVFTGFALLEAWRPRRARQTTRWRRWPSNIGVSFLNQLFVRVSLPLTAAALAVYCAEHHTGLFNHVELPAVVEFIVAVLVLDFAIYLQHRLFHWVPWLWRLHRMHHADLDFDVTTGIRFHPISILLSAMIKLGVIVAIGPSAAAVLTFEILLNATSIFNHSNLAIPPRVDGALRWLIVTPDMHRTHHSVEAVEQNSNFGFNFPWWDRLFATYRGAPALGHTEMTIGLPYFRQTNELSLSRMLWQPFRRASE